MTAPATPTEFRDAVKTYTGGTIQQMAKADPAALSDLESWLKARGGGAG